MSYINNESIWTEPPEICKFNLRYPPWLCQPYVRPPIQEHLDKLQANKEFNANRKRCPLCNTPVSYKCDNELCKACCRNFQCFVEGVECSAHPIHVKQEVDIKYTEEDSLLESNIATFG